MSAEGQSSGGEEKRGEMVDPRQIWINTKDGRAYALNQDTGQYEPLTAEVAERILTRFLKTI